MALSNAQYQSIIHGYEVTQLNNHRIMEERLQEVNSHVDGFKELSASIASVSVSQGRKLLEGDDSALTDLRDTIRRLSGMKQDLLVNAGYPADYLAPIYTCTDCQDTGYLPNREKCHCFKQAIIRLLYEQSGLEKSLSTENFDHLSYDYYEGEALECFRRTVAISKNFIETFDSDYHNLFFYGTVGTGKTFLTNCIAKECIEQGCSVLYFSAASLFDLLARNTFDYRAREELSALCADLYGCDLLVIDDLGTETATAVTLSHFFTCLNERLLRQKSVIISTNLSLEDCRNRYQDRIFSRIASNFEFCKLTGPDIRMCKKVSAVSGPVR